MDIKNQTRERPTSESVERLHIANEIRDILQANTDRLKKIGILKVLAFGSAINGKSKETSDLDISVLIQHQEDQDFSDFTEASILREKILHAMFEELSIPISFRPMQKNEDNKVIHITEDYIEDKNDIPDYAKDALTLWEN